MDTWINNDSLGRYLYAKVYSKEDCFENSMVRSMSSVNIIPAAMVYHDGDMCYEWNISGLDDLKKYSGKMEWKTVDITNFLIQINQVVHTVKNYLLSEGDIILDLSRIFFDSEMHEYKFCVIPGYGNDFEAGLKNLIYEILVNLDCKDIDSLRMGFQLLKESSDPDFKLHNLMEVIKHNQADTIPELEMKEVFLQGAEAGRIAEDTFAAEKDIVNDYMFENPIEIEHQEENNKEQGQKSVSGILGSLAVSQGILILAVLLVFLLKGKELVFRLLPIYLILALCIAACYLLEAMLIKIRGKKTA